MDSSPDLSPFLLDLDLDFGSKDSDLNLDVKAMDLDLDSDLGGSASKLFFHHSGLFCAYKTDSTVTE